jgi:hypothetical protein
MGYEQLHSGKHERRTQMAEQGIIAIQINAKGEVISVDLDGKKLEKSTVYEKTAFDVSTLKDIGRFFIDPKQGGKEICVDVGGRIR